MFRPFVFFSVLAVVLTAAMPAAAACNIRLEVKNLTGIAVTVVSNTFQVRSRTFVPPVLPNYLPPSITRPWGPWRLASNGGWFADRNNVRVPAGDTAWDVYRAQGFCPDYREIRGEVICRGGRRQGQTRGVTMSSRQSGETNPLLRVRVDESACPN